VKLLNVLDQIDVEDDGPALAGGFYLPIFKLLHDPKENMLQK